MTKNAEELKIETDVIRGPEPLKDSFGTWLGCKPRPSPCQLYQTNRFNLLCHFRGTVIKKIWKICLCYSIVTALFFILFGIALEAQAECEDDDARCRPNWFDEYISPLVVIEDNLSVLATFVMVFYANVAYDRFQAFYWECRNVQGKMNNIALIIGSNIAWDRVGECPEMNMWAHDMERYLNLCHFLCHANTSPVLVGKKIFTNKEGAGSVLLEEDILGARLCTEEEYIALYRARSLGDNDAPSRAILGWLTLLFDKGIHHGAGYFRRNITNSRMSSLTFVFQENIEDLRNSISKIRQQMELCVPLAYAQYMQVLIDTVCILHPFVIVYKLNTEIIEHTGFKKVDYWASLPFTLLAQLIFVYFYQGLLSLCIILMDPIGKKEDPARAGEVKDKEFVIEVRSIMNQAKAGTYCLFNTARMAPSGLRSK